MIYYFKYSITFEDKVDLMVDKDKQYREIISQIKSLLSFETDHIAMMATIVCELHHNIPYFDWTGFYRTTEHNVLIIGPYQGSHGCLRISFDRGVCGKAARTKSTQIVADVTKIEDHIACSATTRSEIVVPIFNNTSELIGVLDIDSNMENAFEITDQKYLEEICLLFSH